MVVDHPTLEKFRPLLDRLTTIALTSGTQAIVAHGLRMEDIYHDVAALRRFVRGCHYGYDLAQRQIAAKVIEYEESIRQEENNFRAMRQSRSQDTHITLELIKVLKTRQLILRRLVDSILCLMLGFETWILKRFIVEEKPHRIDPPSLRRITEVAVERNRANRLQFSLVNDLTTFVQIGDLVEIDFSAEQARRWRVIEVKEGKMNELLSGILEKHDYNLSEKDLQAIRLEFGKHAPSQAARMVRQVTRLTEFKKIIETDRGVDPQLKMEIRLTPDVVQTDKYADAVAGICVSARQTGAGVAIVGDCIRLVAIDREKMQPGLAAVVHLFFHLKFRDKKCLFETSGPNEEELHGMYNIPPFVDLIQQNLTGGWVTPLFLWMRPAELFDVLTGQIRVFAQFDFELFFAIAAKENIKLTWATGKNAEDIKKFSPLIPGSPNAHGVLAVLQDGSEHVLTRGFFDRAVADITPPQDLLTLIKRMPEQIAKMEQLQDP